jgi:RNA polymerase sigma-70 factor (ECF subfamily)
MGNRFGAIPVSLKDLAASVTREVAASRQGWILSVMDRCGPAVVAMLWRMLANEQDVLDAYQDCICRVMERGREGVGRSADRYLYRTAANVAIDMIRRRQLRRRHQAPLGRHLTEAHGAPMPGVIESTVLLRQAIVQLPRHLRELVLLRDLAQMPYHRVASILGITVGTARVYRRQAVLRLAELLEGTEAGS